MLFLREYNDEEVFKELVIQRDNCMFCTQVRTLSIVLLLSAAVAVTVAWGGGGGGGGKLT